MAEAAGAPQVMRFGAFEVDLAAGELRKKGMRVRLQEQPFQVLAVLLEEPGRVVTRDELKRRIWPGTVVDFDHGLNTSIAKLREALGDSADAPRFVETLPRRGYRFLCPVEVARVPRANDALHARSVGATPSTATPVMPHGEDDAAGHGSGPAATASSPEAPRRRRAGGLLAFGLPALLLLLALDVGGLRQQLVGRTEIGSIAVLPLKNVSGDPQRDHFADGMTEALSVELGKIGALRVVSHESAAHYRGTQKSLPEIARELRVDALVVGGLLESRGGLRLAATLVQASPEREVWAKTYDFDASEVLVKQKDLARDVAEHIRVKVLPREQVRLGYAPRVDPEAYEAYLLGRAHLAKAPTAETAARAAEYFHAAIEKDPGFAPVHAALAELEMRVRGSRTRKASLARIQARQWVERALELDDTLSEAHATLARIAQQEWDWAGAEREYRRAIELNSSLARARIGYAMFLYAMQRFEEAAAQARRAQQLDPVSPLVHTWAGGAYFLAGRRDEAAAAWKKALELDPTYSDARLAMARTYVVEHRFPEAIAELRTALAMDPKQPLIVGALAHVYARAGQRDDALRLAAELKRLEEEETGYFPPFGTIWAYAGLGDNDEAFARLERAYANRSDRMVWLTVDPLLEPLRSDPRFAHLARRVGLPAASPPQIR